MAPPVKQTLQRKPRASSHEEPSGGIIIPVSSLIPPPPSLSQRRSSRMPPRRDVSNYDGLHSATPSSRSSLQPSSQPFSQQLGKRKRPTASQSQCSFPSASTFESTKFSESVKAQIRRMSSGQKCWHCGADGIDVAHIIPGRAARQVAPRLPSLLHVPCSQRFSYFQI